MVFALISSILRHAVFKPAGAVIVPNIEIRGRSESVVEMCAGWSHIEAMPAVNKERRDERLAARVSGSDKQLLARAAACEGMSVATFVITCARDVARRIIAENNDIELDAAQSRRFVEALLKSTSTVPARVSKAAKQYRQRVGTD